MIRRKPTRIELTPDDVQEYEALKKQAEEKKRQDELELKKRLEGTTGNKKKSVGPEESVGGGFEADFHSEEAKTARTREAAQRRKEKRNARIGY